MKALGLLAAGILFSLSAMAGETVEIQARGYWVCAAHMRTVRGTEGHINGTPSYSQRQAMANAMTACRNSVVPRALLCRPDTCWFHAE